MGSKASISDPANVAKCIARVRLELRSRWMERAWEGEAWSEERVCVSRSYKRICGREVR